MKLYFNIVLLFVIVAFSPTSSSKDRLIDSSVDFINYRAEITPVVENKAINGVVKITFIPLVKDLSQLSFSAKFKQIKSVYFEQTKLQFSITDDLLTVQLPQQLQSHTHYSITVAYEAKPTRGIKFYDDHLFTVYHTKNWLVSHSHLADKASFDLLLTHDINTSSVGNGRLISRTPIGNNKVISHWQHLTPIPLYTFGFALGGFDKLVIRAKDVDISVLYRKRDKSGLTATLIKQAFTDVADMLSFFNDKAGFELENNYTYVLVNGYMAQEASNFSLVGEKFVHTLLNNKNENWFIAHELAHEWWGNSITSANFSHFWLNEGLVVFLIAAYKQHLFGDKAYKDELNVALKRVQKAVKENRVAPVAFRKVIQEQEINRTMAYSKGALVFYMLRQQLGEKLFWQALQQYSVKYRGQSVTTENLKSTFEQVTGSDLTNFFERWVYGQEIPALSL